MDIIKNLKLIIKQFFLNIKFILSDKTIIFSFIFFALISQVISVIFIPFIFSGAVKMFFAQTMPLLLLLGGLSYNWKKSTLNKNQEITSSNKLTIYLSLIITLILVGNIIALFNFFIDFGLGLSGIQLRGWVWENKGAISKMHLENINWFVFFYAINLNILVTFSVYFVIHRLVSNVKNYFIVVLCISILGLIFGGSINNYFYSLWGGNTSINTNIAYGYYIKDSNKLFPDSFFPISLIFPFFSTSEFYQTSIFVPLVEFSSSNQDLLMHLDKTKNIWPFFISFSHDYWQWALILIFPYIHIFLNFIIGTLMSLFVKKK